MRRRKVYPNRDQDTETSQRCALSLDATLQQRTRRGLVLHDILQDSGLHHVAQLHLQLLTGQHKERVEPGAS